MLNVVAFPSGGQIVLAFDKRDGTTVGFLVPETGELVFDPELSAVEVLSLLPQVMLALDGFIEALRAKVQGQDASTESAARFAVGLTVGAVRASGTTVYLN